MWKTPEEYETAVAMRDLAEKNILESIGEFLKDPAGTVEARAAECNQTGRAGLRAKPRTRPGTRRRA